MVSIHLKNMSESGNLPQVGMNMKNIWNHHLVYIWYLHITYIQKTSQIITLLQKVLPNGLCPKRESKKPPVTRNAATPGNSDGVRVRKRIELRKKKRPDFPWNTVDGSEILHQLRLVVYHIICRVLYIPGGAGFLPSTVLVGSYRFL